MAWSAYLERQESSRAIVVKTLNLLQSPNIQNYYENLSSTVVMTKISITSKTKLDNTDDIISSQMRFNGANIHVSFQYRGLDLPSD